MLGRQGWKGKENRTRRGGCPASHAAPLHRCGVDNTECSLGVHAPAGMCAAAVGHTKRWWACVHQQLSRLMACLLTFVPTVPCIAAAAPAFLLVLCRLQR